MLDFLFRFSVLNTAFSVIGNEIGQKLGSLGGRWFRCLYIWTLYVIISKWWNNTLYTQVSSVAVVCFLVANGYLAVIDRLRNVKYLHFLDKSFVRRLSGRLVKLSFPVVLWRSIWDPVNDGLDYTGCLLFGGNPSLVYTWCTKGLAFVLLCAIVRLFCQSSYPPKPVITDVITKSTDVITKSTDVLTKSTDVLTKSRTPPPVPQRPPSARIQAMRARNNMQLKLEDLDKGDHTYT